jgi:hypothetical protein
MTEVNMPGWGKSEPNSGYQHQMDTPFGRYTVVSRGEYGFGWKRPAYFPYMGFEPTEDFAKNAAEVDYRNRVKLAVEGPKP